MWVRTVIKKILVLTKEILVTYSWISNVWERLGTGYLSTFFSSFNLNFAWFTFRGFWWLCCPQENFTFLFFFSFSLFDNRLLLRVPREVDLGAVSSASDSPLVSSLFFRFLFFADLLLLSHCAYFSSVIIMHFLLLDRWKLAVSEATNVKRV